MTTTTSSRASVEDDAEVPPSSGVPHRKLIIGAAVAIALALAATWLVAFSSVFGVRTVDVRGVHLLTTAQVRAAARIADGTPLVRLDTDAVRTRIAALPDIRSVTVTTSFPSTVTITVVERTPVGIVEDGGTYRLVDSTGDQYRSVAKRPEYLPLFVVPAGTSARTTGGAVAVVAAALPAAVRKRVVSIQALDPGAITLLLKNGRVVSWGSATRGAEKARVLVALLRQQGTRFDVSDPAQPFTH